MAGKMLCLTLLALTSVVRASDVSIEVPQNGQTLPEQKIPAIPGWVSILPPLPEQTNRPVRAKLTYSL
jgi:hypothetical protein